MSSLKDDIFAAMRGQKPHPFPRAPGLHVTPTYVVREDELMQLIAEMTDADATETLINDLVAALKCAIDETMEYATTVDLINAVLARAMEAGYRGDA